MESRPPVVTIAAVATPPGRGGIGVVRVSGTAGGVAAIVAGVLARDLAPRLATHATFRDARGGPIDRGLAILFPAPASYTGETVAEFHGHGSPAAMLLLLARCVELGARLAEPGEFTKRAFLNGKLDLAQAESVADLIDAANATAARAAARSLAGEFSREVRAIVESQVAGDEPLVGEDRQSVRGADRVGERRMHGDGARRTTTNVTHLEASNRGVSAEKTKQMHHEIVPASLYNGASGHG